MSGIRQTAKPPSTQGRSQGKCSKCGQLSLIKPHLGLLRSMDLGWLCTDCFRDLLQKCDLCGTPRVPDRIKTIKYTDLDTQEIVEKHLCPSCAQSFVPCSCCGTHFDNRPQNRVKFSPLITGSNVGRICPKCRDREFELCPSCGRYEHKPHMSTLHKADGTTVRLCRTCKQALHSTAQIFMCDNCHEWHEIALRDERQELIERAQLCRTCGPRIGVCVECGSLRPRASLDAEGYCLQCVTSRYGLHQYSFTPRPLKFHKLELESEAADPFLGLELEVDQHNGRPTVTQEKLATLVTKAIGYDQVYCKTDGSLQSGVEQVTHPATLGHYLTNREQYDQLCKIPAQYGYRSHDSGNCGLHVHVGRRYFGATPEVAISRVIWLVERFWVEMFRFSRRDGPDLTQWAARYLGPQGARDPTKIKKEDLLRTATGGSRYRAVNLQRPATIEFRLFRGTLNLETFWATMQLVDNLVRLAKQSDDEQMLKTTWQDIVAFKTYPELTNYSARRIGTEPLPLQTSVVVPDITDDGWKTTFRKLLVPQMPPELQQQPVATTKMRIVDLSNEVIQRWFMQNESYFNARGPVWIVPRDMLEYYQLAGLLVEDRMLYGGGLGDEVLGVLPEHRSHPLHVQNPAFIVPESWVPEPLRAVCPSKQFEILTQAQQGGS